MSSSVAAHDGVDIGRELGVSPSIDVGREIGRRVAFLAGKLLDTGLTTLVLGISGGVDSAVAGMLCQRAVQQRRDGGGEATFVAMRLPYGTQRDATDVEAALAAIGPDRVLDTNIAPASDAMLEGLRAGGLTLDDPVRADFVLGNVKARERMIAQYAVAGALNGLVVGTDHAAEAVMGFYTKHGDGAADLTPLSGLTKRQVRALGAELGVPAAIVTKVPTADLESLRPGLPDEAVYGVSYDTIDDFLEGRPVPPEATERILRHYRATAHKRALPIAPPAEVRPAD